MLDKSIILKHYSRKEIIEELLYSAKGREIAVRYNDSFGKRPDTIKYQEDVITLAKSGATSFHCSQELWKNPLQLSSTTDKRALEQLRTGWDLVIDIDCKIWEFSKLVAYLIIKALKKHNIKSISCKFSGNKGFHIAVPYEAFLINEKVNGQEIKNLFPDGTKKVLAYLSSYIDRKENNYEMTRLILSKHTPSEIAKILDTEPEKLFRNICEACGKEKSKKQQTEEITCPSCNERNTINSQIITCKRCKYQIKAPSYGTQETCTSFKGSQFIDKLNTSQIIGLDTILISPRHLFRMAYSLHESSGLCSLPIAPEDILSFDKENATPENIRHFVRFLDKEKAIIGEGFPLIRTAYDFAAKNITYAKAKSSEEKIYAIPTKALPQKTFPPCINLILNGLSDGRKRALFILINFLTSAGWSIEEMRKLIEEWNTKNPEPLPQNYIESQLNYHIYTKKKILPPNCKNQGYYIDIGVCKPDNLCSTIKNPVNYAIKRAKIKR